MTEFKVGDKVRYTGSTRELLGLEGVVTNSAGSVTSFAVTKANAFYGLGHTVYPDTANLQPMEPPSTEGDAVEHPAHYGGADNPYEVIKVAEAWGLDKDAYLFNVLKYVARAGKKGAALEDLKKGRFYIDRKIKNMVSAE